MAPNSVTDQSIPGGWTERELLIGERRLRLVLPAQPVEFLERLEQTSVVGQETDPYWAELWPASLSMARLIYAASWPRSAQAVELGCGIGLAGVAALAAGLEVTFTDRVELAVATAVENAHRNGFADARGFVLDWAQPRHQQYQIIFACDVLYDRKLHLPLLCAIQALLADGGECWIGDPGRTAAESFLEQAELAGFTMRMQDETGRAAANLVLGEFRLLLVSRALARRSSTESC